MFGNGFYDHDRAVAVEGGCVTMCLTSEETWNVLNTDRKLNDCVRAIREWAAGGD